MMKLYQFILLESCIEDSLRNIIQGYRKVTNLLKENIEELEKEANQ